MLLKHACTFLCLYCTCGCFPFTIIRGCLCPSCESHVSVPMQARLLFMRGGLSLVGGGYYFNVRWSARPLRMCEAHQRLPARLPNDQVLSMSCATSKPLVPFPFFPFLLSLQSVTISPSFLFLLFSLRAFFNITFLSAFKRCAWMPTILLAARKKTRVSGHHKFMWNEALNTSVFLI